MKKHEVQSRIDQVKTYLLQLQTKICQTLDKEDGYASFNPVPWKQPGFGEGITCTVANGHVLEKGGVNFSHVFGHTLPPAATANRPQLIGCQYQVLGLSLVIHPLNPYVPTSHANVRFFIAEHENSDEVTFWFGGGYDLTPYYGFEEDCTHWHQIAKDACAILGIDAYPRYKTWCDEYFYLKHRNEPRGIGGLFYDDLSEPDFETCFTFMQNVGNSYLDAYVPIVQRRKNIPFGEREKEFQLYRRGRYVEYNLLYDRGTLFGLQTSPRTEAILMSLPPVVHWVYDWQPEENSEEARLYRDFLKPKNWVVESV